MAKSIEDIVREELKLYFMKEIIREELFHYLTMTEDGEVELHNNKVEPPKPPAEDGSDAAQQAHALGLKSGGYGRWVDASGKTVAKTVKGYLVKVEPHEQEPQQPQAKDIYAQAGREKPSEDDPYGIGNANATAPSAAVPQSHPVTHVASNQNHDEPYATQQPSAQPVVKPNAAPENPYDEKVPLRGARPEKYKTSDFGDAQQTISRAIKAARNGSPEQQVAVRRNLDKLRQPGSINPPKKQDGSPWEVTTPDGRRGMIDFINRDDREAHVTFDDGTMDMVPLKGLKPVNPSNKQPEPEGPIFPGDQGDSPGPWDKKIA